jgi:acetyl esterase/lipase
VAPGPQPQYAIEAFSKQQEPKTMHLIPRFCTLAPRRLQAIALAAAMLLPFSGHAQDAREFKDIAYAPDLGLDLYMPANVASPPLIVFVHGGAWRAGSKDRAPTVFVDNGFALASLDFRQSGEAPFPAMIHDIKGAIRFLRAHAGDYGYNPDRIAITGESSGGHLAALVGITNGHAELEGTVGGNSDQSSDVQAIMSYFGASDLTTILQQSTSFGFGLREPALEALLGTVPEEDPEIAALASPVTHVDANDPPLLLLHGDRDPQMPINQAHQLEGAYEELGLDITFDVVHGAAHGGAAFYDDTHLPVALAFLRRTIAH